MQTILPESLSKLFLKSQKCGIMYILYFLTINGTGIIRIIFISITEITVIIHGFGYIQTTFWMFIQRWIIKNTEVCLILEFSIFNAPQLSFWFCHPTVVFFWLVWQPYKRCHCRLMFRPQGSLSCSNSTFVLTFFSSYVSSFSVNLLLINVKLLQTRVFTPCHGLP